MRVRNQESSDREKPQHCHDLSPTMEDLINADAGLLAVLQCLTGLTTVRLLCYQGMIIRELEMNYI